MKNKNSKKDIKASLDFYEGLQTASVVPTPTLPESMLQLEKHKYYNLFSTYKKLEVKYSYSTFLRLIKNDRNFSVVNGYFSRIKG
ncbi:MAG: hypothetical protein AAGI07_07780 [Bacteroidota bacterium]